MISQCEHGSLQPELYRSGSVALALGVEAGCDAWIPLRTRDVAATAAFSAVHGSSCMLLNLGLSDLWRVAAGRKCLRSVQALR